MGSAGSASITAAQAMGFVRSWVAARQSADGRAIQSHLHPACEFVVPAWRRTREKVCGAHVVTRLLQLTKRLPQGEALRLGSVVIDFEERRVAIMYLRCGDECHAELIELGLDGLVRRGEWFTGADARTLLPYRAPRTPRRDIDSVDALAQKRA